MKYLLIFTSSFLLSLVSVPICIKIAKRFNILDKPDDNLKRHKKPIPYLGGVAIFLSFFIALFVYEMATAHTIKGLVGIIIGASLIFLLGLVDDIKKLNIPFKFFIQILSAVILIVCDIKINFLGNEFSNNIITVLWIVGVTNAFNFVDIMDGLAGGVAFIALITFFIIGMEGGKLFSPLASLSLAGSILGFLVYNFPPARIFMGDAGSLFIGFMLGTLAITESYSFTNNLAVMTPIIILGVPIFDTLFVMWVRWKQGKPVYFGSSDHFPLRLLKLRLNRKQVMFIIYSISIFLAITGYILIRLNEFFSGILYIFVFIISIFLTCRLSKIS
ncbi:MAG: MraY family glycosyltransferase [Candidatus Firestonebacteria bacterium]